MLTKLALFEAARSDSEFLAPVSPHSQAGGETLKEKSFGQGGWNAEGSLPAYARDIASHQTASSSRANNMQRAFLSNSRGPSHAGGQSHAGSYRPLAGNGFCVTENGEDVGTAELGEENQGLNKCQEKCDQNLMCTAIAHSEFWNTCLLYLVPVSQSNVKAAKVNHAAGNDDIDDDDDTKCYIKQPNGQHINATHGSHPRQGQQQQQASTTGWWHRPVALPVIKQEIQQNNPPQGRHQHRYAGGIPEDRKYEVNPADMMEQRWGAPTHSRDVPEDRKYEVNPADMMEQRWGAPTHSRDGGVTTADYELAQFLKEAADKGLIKMAGSSTGFRTDVFDYLYSKAPGRAGTVSRMDFAAQIRALVRKCQGDSDLQRLVPSKIQDKFREY